MGRIVASFVRVEDRVAAGLLRPAAGVRVCGRILGSLHTVFTAFVRTPLTQFFAILVAFAAGVRACALRAVTTGGGFAVGAARLAVSPHRAAGGCGSIAARSPGCAGSGRELSGGPAVVTAVALAQSAAPLDRWPGGKLLPATLSPIGNQIVAGAWAAER